MPRGCSLIAVPQARGPREYWLSARRPLASPAKAARTAQCAVPYGIDSTSRIDSARPMAKASTNRVHKAASIKKGGKNGCFVYLLGTSGKDRTLTYVGWTLDLDRRLAQHNG